MKYAVAFALLLNATATWADTPWNRDCVTWWGGKIPVEKRTQENCPNGHSHWDDTVTGGGSIPHATKWSGSTTAPLNPSLPTTIVTGQGTILIVPNYSGGSLPRAIIPVSK